MTLKEFAKDYPYNPCYHNVGDPIVVFPLYKPEQEKGFWDLSDYHVRSITGGTIWLARRDSTKWDTL